MQRASTNRCFFLRQQQRFNSTTKLRGSSTLRYRRRSVLPRAGLLSNSGRYKESYIHNIYWCSAYLLHSMQLCTCAFVHKEQTSRWGTMRSHKSGSWTSSS